MTEAQIYRVRRIISGTKYHVSWDGRGAWEMRRETKCTYRPVADKSVLAMFKRGWVEFKSTAKKRNWMPLRSEAKRSWL